MVFVAATFIALKVSTATNPAAWEGLIGGPASDYLELSFELANFVTALALFVAAVSRAWKTLDDASANLALAVIAMALLGASQAASAQKTKAGLAVAVIIDLVALLFSLGGEFLGLGYPLRPGIGVGKHYSILVPIAFGLQVASATMAIGAFVADLYQLSNLPP
jgi:hypothetical protein